MNTDSVASLLLEAASLMLIGMVFVFSFLGLLILGIHLIAKFCSVFPGEVASESVGADRMANAQQPSVEGSITDGSGIEKNVIAAISAAIHAHRKTNKNS